MLQSIELKNLALKDTEEKYLPDQGLVDAIEIAIALDKPLLITGEPGTGKTKLALWLSKLLAIQTEGNACAFRNKPFIFNTKSTSTASDLFYNYDAVSHFGKVQRSKSIEVGTPDDDKLTR